MGILEQLTDRYGSVARLMPALLVVLPISLLALTAVPVVLTTWGKVAALVVASGLPFAVMQVVRDRGRGVEPSLFASWGGRPTEVMLRWSGSSTPATLRRRHGLIEKHLDITLPDEAAEQTNPAAAEAQYEVATDALRMRTRDSSRFPLVKHELTAYGFRRNTYACRALGLVVCLLAAVVTVVLGWSGAVPLGWMQQAALVAFDATAAVVWSRVVSAEWVRRAAETYAQQLLLSLESMEALDTQPDPGQ